MSNKANNKEQNNKGANSAQHRQNRSNNRNKSNDRGNNFKALDKGARTNDPNWYFESKDLAEQSLNYSFETIMASEAISDSEYIPFIAVVALNASPGGSYFCNEPGTQGAAPVVPNPADVIEGYDGANYMASRIYTLLSAASGRNAQYQANDVLMSILANSSIVEAIESLRRFFGLAFLYSQYNRALPRRICESMGLDFADFIDHLEDYREALNFEISRINQVPILSNIGYMRKSLELYQRIFVDEDSPYAQYFCYVPGTVWQLDEQSYKNGSNLLTVDWLSKSTINSETQTYGPRSAINHSLITMGDLISQLRLMINEVLNSTTLNLVYMDLIHAAGKDSSISFIKLDTVTSDYVVMPVLDKTASLQFHNLRTLNSIFWATRPATGADSITDTIAGTSILATPRNDVASDPNTGRIIYNPLMSDDGFNNSTAIVDFFEPNPSLEDRIEAQRFTLVKSNYVAKVGSGTRDWSFLHVLPDHYPLFIALSGGTAVNWDTVNSKLNVTQNGTQTLYDLSFNFNGTATSIDAVKQSYAFGFNWLQLTKFRNHPIVVCYDRATGVRFTSIGNLSYYTKIPFYKMKRINQYVYAGLFAFR